MTTPTQPGRRTVVLRRPAAYGLVAATSIFVLMPPADADRVRDDQRHLEHLDIAHPHELSQGEGITVAVVDTGIDPDHPGLAGNVLPGLDVVVGGTGDG